MQSTLLASTLAQPKDTIKGNSIILNQDNKTSLFTVKMEGNYRVLEGVGVLEVPGTDKQLIEAESQRKQMILDRVLTKAQKKQKVH